MKKILIITYLLLLLIKANAQSNTIDTLKQLLSVAKEDTNKVQLLINMGWAFQWNEPDSTILYYKTHRRRNRIGVELKL